VQISSLERVYAHTLDPFAKIALLPRVYALASPTREDDLDSTGTRDLCMEWDSLLSIEMVNLDSMRLWIC